MTTAELYRTVGPYEVHSPEWHAHRRSCIGASEVAGILGVDGAYSTALEIWADKVGQAPQEDEGSEKEWLHFGQVLEPIIANEFERRAGYTVEPEGRQFVSVAHPWLGCSLDYWCFQHRQATKKQPPMYPLELKNTGSFMSHRWKEGVWLPYQIQVQVQMAVTGADQAAVAVLIGGNEFKWAMVDRNQRFIDAMMEKLERFWELVERDEMPDVTGADTKLVGVLLGKEEAGTSVALLGPWVDVDEELQSIKAEIKEKNKRKSLLEARLKKEIGVNERGVLPGGAQYTFKTIKRPGYTVQDSESRQLRRIKGGKSG